MVASGEAKAGAALGGAIIVGVTVALSNYRRAQGTRETADKPEE